MWCSFVKSTRKFTLKFWFHNFCFFASCPQHDTFSIPIHYVIKVWVYEKFNDHRFKGGLHIHTTFRSFNTKFTKNLEIEIFFLQFPVRVLSQFRDNIIAFFGLLALLSVHWPHQNLISYSVDSSRCPTHLCYCLTFAWAAAKMCPITSRQPAPVQYRSLANSLSRYRDKCHCIDRQIATTHAIDNQLVQQSDFRSILVPRDTAIRPHGPLRRYCQ